MWNVKHDLCHCPLLHRISCFDMMHPLSYHSRKHRTVAYRHQLVHLSVRKQSPAYDILHWFLTFSWPPFTERPPFWFLHISKEQTCCFFFLVWYLPTACCILFFKATLHLHPRDDNHFILFSVSKQIALAVFGIIWILYSKKAWFVVNTLYYKIY